jgi:hypothetical protein
MGVLWFVVGFYIGTAFTLLRAFDRDRSQPAVRRAPMRRPTGPLVRATARKGLAARLLR